MRLIEFVQLKYKYRPIFSKAFPTISLSALSLGRQLKRGPLLVPNHYTSFSPLRAATESRQKYPTANKKYLATYNQRL